MIFDSTKQEAEIVNGDNLLLEEDPHDFEEVPLGSISPMERVGTNNKTPLEGKPSDKTLLTEEEGDFEEVPLGSISTMEGIGTNNKTPLEGNSDNASLTKEINDFEKKLLVSVISKAKMVNNDKKAHIQRGKEEKSEKQLGEIAQELQQELKLIKTPGKQEKQDILEKHFEDRIIVQESQFKQKNKKDLGTTIGYIAVKQKDPNGLPFMMKIAIKSGKTRCKTYNAMGFVNEFISAPLYKRTLYDRTPIIDGVITHDSQTLAFRSKFLHDFQTVSQFTESSVDTLIGAQYKKLKQVEGAEKVFAAMLAWGEYDIHAGNFGVMKVKDDITGKDKYVIAKIDHGFSATQFFTDPNVALENLARAYERYGYQGKLSLDVTKLKEALDQITYISDDEIETLVKSRVFKLKKMGFKIKDLQFEYFEDDSDHDWNVPNKTESFTNFKELENHYINHYKTQMVTMKQISQNLDMIAKIIPVEDTWKNGQWLQDIRGQNPVEWAQKNNKTINGLNEWNNLFSKSKKI